MGVSAAVGVISAPAVTGNQTYNLSGGNWGSGVTPQALIAYWTEQTAEGSAAEAIFSIGVATYRGSAVGQGGIVMSSQDAQASATGAFLIYDSSLCRIVDPGGATTDGEIDFVSFGSDQFVLNWVNLPGTATTLLSYLVLGGTDITDALAFDFLTTTGATVDVDVATGFGQPDLLLFIAAPWDQSVINTADGTAAGLSLGAGIKDGTTRCTVMSEDTGSVSMDMGLWQQSAVILQPDHATLSTEDTEITLSASSAWPTDGFELTLTNAPAGDSPVVCLALKGTFQKALSARVTPTSISDSDYNVGFTPKAAFCWGGNIIPAAGATTPDTGNAQLGQLWVGATDGTNETLKGWSQEDGALDSDTYSYHSSSKTVQMHNADDASLLLEADGSFTGTTFRLSYNDIDATSREFNALVIGETAAAGEAVTQRPPMRALLGVGV